MPIWNIGYSAIATLSIKKLVDSAIALLHTGDLVLRTGADVTSYMFTQMNQTNKTYSHCGIVIIENGYPFIYHSIGGEDNPDQVIRRDSASFWFSPANNLGLGIFRYQIEQAVTDSIVAMTLKYYKEKKMFDMNFDLATDDRLYCAEFVYKIVNHSLKKELITASQRFGYRFVAIDNLILNSKTSAVWQVRYK